jgi:hypothetical protein
MSNTRRATPGKPLRQERWSSSEHFEEGIKANLVARRCKKLCAQDREIIYFIQAASHSEGGLRKFCKDLGAMFPERIGTRSMQEFGMRPGQVYSAKQQRAIFAEMPGAPRFDPADLLGHDPEPEREPQPCRWEKLFDRESAVATLPDFLAEMCLNPACRLEGPWYFPGLVPSLVEFQSNCRKSLNAASVSTEIGNTISETLEYALETKCLVLIEGEARTGKTFAAKAWCQQRPGRCRYVQIPSTNDDLGFFQAIAKSLGMCFGHGYKAFEIRQRVEEVLQTGDLLLVMDEAHYLWPTSDCRRYTLPGRINWLMTALANHGVPVALVTTPQFIRTQKEIETRSHWTSEQFIGRIGHYAPLPKRLSEADLVRVAKALLPEGDAKSIGVLADYATGSAKYLGGIECVVRRARFLAGKSGRDRVERSDIRRAISESVIPSDTALANALAAPGRRGSRAATKFTVPLTAPETEFNRGPAGDFSSPVEREIAPLAAS